MKHAKQDVRLAGIPIEECNHICAFFNAPEEFYRVLAPFIKEGIKRGDKAFHIIDAARRGEHMQRLETAGIEAAAAEQNGQLEICGWYDAYLRENRFDPEAMLALIQDVLNRGKDEGFPLTRLIANMEWALEDQPGVEALIEYEARLNYILPRYHDPVICTYDCSRFGAQIIMDMLRTHPMVILGGSLQRNPFYVPPDAFLHELRSRTEQSALA